MDELLYMEINIRKFGENLQEISKVSRKDLIPVIKSSAYGMGDIEIARKIEELGINLVAVVDLAEALRLAQEGFNFEILILNGIRESEYKYLDRYSKLVVSVNTLEEAKRLVNYSFYRTIKVHMQIDTGMNRLGFTDFWDYYEALRQIVFTKGFILEGIYTHFTDPENLKTQLERFEPYLKQYPYRIIHTSASSTYPLSDFGTHLRIGADLYAQQVGNLKQIIKIACKPLVINKIKKGESVGYDRAFKAERDELIAVLPIGYSNGYRRSLSGFPVLANNKQYPTVGKVCMNHLFVRVDREVNLDTEFVITSEELPVGMIAKYLRTVPHEILCMFKINNIRYLK
ncbi:MAG TPA: alanine racemase [Acholeplasmataceae bacterium]|jgi:alanine racemase|nr:alanine racemase [Acholeplasmataceae bacterium]